MVSLVYMVAGLSSRFGGKIKQFALVGPNGETFIEYSINQAIKAVPINKIIFIISNKTEIPFKEKFKDNYKGIPIYYARQEYDLEKRDKPWGTADALCSALPFIKEPCIVCNGDDLYGKNFNTIYNHLKNNSKENAVIGIKLKDVLPEKGEVTRGIFKVKDNYLISAKEIFKLSKNNYQNLSPNNLCNINLFLLYPETIKKLNERVKSFKEKNKNDRKIECFIHTELAELIKEGIKIKVYPSIEKWIGITNPEDEVVVKELLKNG